jgi:hypothetical protein
MGDGGDYKPMQPKPIPPNPAIRSCTSALRINTAGSAIGCHKSKKA